MADTAHIDQIGRSVEKLSGGLLSAYGGFKLVTGAVEFLRNRMTDLERPEEKLVAGVTQLASELADITESTGEAIKGYEQEVAEKRRALNWARLSLQAEQELTHVSRARLGLLTLQVTVLRQVAGLYTDINQNLIEADSSAWERYRLVQSTLRVVGETGISYQNVTKAAAALVHYGMENEVTWNRNLKLVSQLEQAIGLSVQEGAKLVVIYERQLNASASRLADTLATIVNRTALSANEAARLAESIGLAVGALQEGLGANVPEVIAVVGEYESAFKRLGGQTGELTKLLSTLTTIQGLPAAGLVGVGGPEFLASAEMTEDTLRHIGQTVQAYTRGLSGWQRVAQLDMLSQVFNLTAQQLNLIGRLQDEVNNKRGEEITVQQRFQEQMAATLQGTKRLGAELMALVQRGLAPVVKTLNIVVTWLADFVAWLNRNAVAANALAATIGTVFTLFAVGVGIQAVGAVMRLTASMYSMIFAANMASVRLGSFTHLMQSISTYGIRSGPGRFLGGARAAGGLASLGYLAAILGAATAIVGIIGLVAHYMKRMYDAQREERETREAADRVRRNLVESAERVIQRGLVHRNELDVARSARILAESYAKEKRVSMIEALEWVRKTHIDPVVAQIRATEAIKTLSTDTRGAPGTVGMEDFLYKVNKNLEADIAAQKDIARVQLEALQRSETNQKLQNAANIGSYSIRPPSTNAPPVSQLPGFLPVRTY